tara:strand:- start:157 stop:762 length:606 start_codon:yes stop_codon:yes gene_type:complete
MKKAINIIVITIAILFLFKTDLKAYTGDPKEFISQLVGEAKSILSSSDGQEEKAKKLGNLALENVDIKALALYTVGPYRKEMTEDELKKYHTLFEKYFLKSFTSRLTEYSDPKIEITGVEVKNPKYTIVQSKLLGTSEKPEVKIDWRVYTKNPEKPLIRDLIVEGLSLARTQKEEFVSIIESNDGDINKLFERLEEFINKN